MKKWKAHFVVSEEIECPTMPLQDTAVRKSDFLRLCFSLTELKASCSELAGIMLTQVSQLHMVTSYFLQTEWNISFNQTHKERKIGLFLKLSTSNRSANAKQTTSYHLRETELLWELKSFQRLSSGHFMTLDLPSVLGIIHQKKKKFSKQCFLASVDQDNVGP